MAKENQVDTELIDKFDVEIEKVDQKELEKRDENAPHFKEKIDLDDGQVDRLRKEIFKHYDRLKDERETEHLDTKWEELDAQYKGEMIDDANLEFAMDVGITQVKLDAVERLSAKAFLESDPKFAITPRPVMAKTDKMDETVEAQSDYLDYKLEEEIPLASPLRKVLHQAYTLDGGIMKIPYAHIRKKRRREEHYSGKINEDEQGNKTQPGLESFVQDYPEAIIPGNEGHWVLKDLMAQKDVTFKADFWDTEYSDPMPGFVDCKDFYVSKNTEGYRGLCEAQITIEKQRYTWWELKKLEQNEDFENVDDAKYEINEDGDVGPSEDKAEDYRTKQYEVLECVYCFNQEADLENPTQPSDDPETEIRIVCWFEIRSKAFLGAILYPYDTVECYYVPFYSKDKKAGFYKGGMAEDITDDHLVQNAFVNFMLTESWQQLQTTPILKEGNPIADQFLNKRWKPGVPLIVPQETMDVTKEMGFLERPRTGVSQQMINIVLYLGKLVDDKTGVSSLATGKESPTDPTAPAAKTAMLLKQSGINIGEYINCLLPSFNLVGEIILQLTYQMSEGGRKYRQRQRAGSVVGQDPFGEITRDQMKAKTNIQSRALGFAFDKVNEKRENLALFQLMRGDPLVARNAEGVYALAKTLISSWSPLWKNKVDNLIQTEQEFQMDQFKTCIQALQAYLQQLMQKAQVTGVAPEPQLQEFIAMASQMMKEAITPPSEEEQKAREKQQ